MPRPSPGPVGGRIWGLRNAGLSAVAELPRNRRSFARRSQSPRSQSPRWRPPLNPRGSPTNRPPGPPAPGQWALGRAPGPGDRPPGPPAGCSRDECKGRARGPLGTPERDAPRGDAWSHPRQTIEGAHRSTAILPPTPGNRAAGPGSAWRFNPRIQIRSKVRRCRPERDSQRRGPNRRRTELTGCPNGTLADRFQGPEPGGSGP